MKIRVVYTLIRKLQAQVEPGVLMAIGQHPGASAKPTFVWTHQLDWVESPKDLDRILEPRKTSWVSPKQGDLSSGRATA